MELLMQNGLLEGDLELLNCTDDRGSASEHIIEPNSTHHVCVEVDEHDWELEKIDDSDDDEDETEIEKAGAGTSHPLPDSLEKGKTMPTSTTLVASSTASIGSKLSTLRGNRLDGEACIHAPIC
jgi:hypothetical protein